MHTPKQPMTYRRDKGCPAHAGPRRKRPAGPVASLDLVRSCLRCGARFKPRDGHGRPTLFIRLCHLCRVMNSAAATGAVPEHSVSGRIMGCKYDDSSSLRPIQRPGYISTS